MSKTLGFTYFFRQHYEVFIIILNKRSYFFLPLYVVCSRQFIYTVFEVEKIVWMPWWTSLLILRNIAMFNIIPQYKLRIHYIFLEEY